MISQFEASRHSGKPVKLYLFDGSDTSMESLARSVVIGPGATEYGLGTTTVRTGTGEPVNNHAGLAVSDFGAAMDELRAVSEDIRHVTIQVAWYGSDLRANDCTITPRIESRTTTTVPYAWQVGQQTRSNATLLLGSDLHGSPSDRSIYEAIRYFRTRGVRVTLSPIVLMDIPEGNSLPNPYGGTGQPANPWRGLISCTSPSDNGTSAASTQANNFFSTAVAASAFGWDATNLRVTYAGTNARYRRFIFHMATIAAAANATGFLIGSELVGLTRLRSSNTNYPAVNLLRTLAADVRTILGPDRDISYGADWTEFHSDHYGTSVVFNMDPLWTDPNINFIGIQNFAPTTDWRSTTFHADRVAGYPSIYDISYQQAGIEGGEFYDWIYPTQAARNSQSRSAITDAAYGKPWVFRQKDIRSWWANEHRNRINGVESGSPTTWVPRSKQIVFTALGCPAVDKGSNQPSASRPHHSSNRPDAAVQRAFIEAHLRYWGANNPWSGVYGGRMLRMSETSLSYWDARPYPEYPERTTAWLDTGAWLRGQTLSGRMVPGRAFDAGPVGPFAFCDGETPITRDGITYQSWPIKHSRISQNGTLDKSDLQITLAKGSEMDPLFLAYPPSKVINATIFQGHAGDDATLANFPAMWMGQVGGMTFENSERAVNCTPVSTTLRRPGLRRNYQVGCPHLLYGEQCRAIRRTATYERTVASILGQRVTMSEDIELDSNQQLAGGLLEWTDAASGRTEIRTIARRQSAHLFIRGLLRGLQPGMTIKVSRGCNHQMSGCLGFNNILNYGGQPFIPTENPLSQKSQFY